jgi:hypothetical protein
MRSFARIALLAAIFVLGVVAFQRLSALRSSEIPAPRQRARPAPQSPQRSPAYSSPAPAEPPVAFGGAYGEPTRDVSTDEGRTHYELGAQLLALGDYYSAASHLASARAGLGDQAGICELLAIAYDRLNMTRDLLEIMECLEKAALDSPAAAQLFDRLERELDVEEEFLAAASDHFVASYPAPGPSAEAIGNVLDLLEQAHRRIRNEIGFASTRLVPVVIYEGRQFEAATGKPHWASGIYDGKIRIAIENYHDRPEFFETALVHEYVHALTHEYTGPRLPPWFREGLADNLARRGAAARGLLESSLDERRFFEIEDLETTFTQLPEELAISAYRQSFKMVNNLVAEAGWGAIEDLLHDLHGNRKLGFDAAFSDLYGESPAEYLDRWYAANF